MPSSKKKIGGVKNRTTATDPMPSGTTGSRKKIGGVRPGVRGVNAESTQMQSCPINCPGEYVGKMWIHSRDCPWVAVLWDAHGATEKQWRCPFDCDPHRLPSGWTHPHDCEFWNHTSQTPFDDAAPSTHDRPVHHLESQLLTERLTREQKREIAKRTNAAYRATFEEFPKALQSDDDDLPF